jgi:arabinofuranan 3-O-arabinosyltransferase
MVRVIDWARRHPDRSAATLLALCAYVPILLTEPGRISADTKSYLTLDPGAVLGQATSMWDPTVGAGTVPHQNIGYLFPLGPYYWVMEAIGSPDWVTQRLLWGTLVFAAAFGMYRLARWLGWSAAGAFVAAFTYGFGPYVLSYLARLSVILGPWAALPWMVLLVAKAARTRSWRPAAWFAVIVALVGSVNATSLVLAGLGPVIWLVCDVVAGRVRVGDAVRAAAKIGVLCAAVSVWWIVALRIQGTYGIPILRYTETYQSVASASTPAEIMRGLGYWFLYGGDRLDPWVEPAVAYFDNPALMTLGFVLAGIALLGFLTPFVGRAASAVLLLVGLAVAVGAAPLGSSTPYGALFEWFASDTTAGLALRSTPRAAPLVVFAVAFGTAASSEWLRARLAERAAARERPAPQRIALVVPAVMVGLVALQLFPWFTGNALSSSLLRDAELPAYETELAEWLDATRDPDSGGRVWEIPAADFANYRWGGTVDPVLPGIIERPYLARDVVLQGGAATSDLLNAFERRLPEGWFEPETLPTIAARFGVDTIVVRNDLEHERYLLARPGPLWTDLVTALGEPDFAGPTVTDDTVIPLLDERTLADPDIAETFPVVAAWHLEPAPLVQTAPADAPIVIAGTAEGLVDLAGAELSADPSVADRPVLFATTLFDLDAAGELDPAMLGDDTWWVVTDTHRKQARHWSTVSSNLGALEAAGPLWLDEDPSNQQLDVFAPDDAPDALERRTIAVHAADVADVRASYYGNRVAFTPGDAPHFAVDGDPATAWRAGAFGRTTGLFWELDLRERVETSSITVQQPVTGATNRYIVDARITLDDGTADETTFDVTLDESSRAVPGQTIELPVDGFRTLRIEVRRDNIGDIADYTTLPAVGIAEVTIPGVVDDRLVRLPRLDAFGLIDEERLADQRLTYLFTRQRIDPATPNEAPAERSLVRQFEVPESRTFVLSGEARLGGRASEEALAGLFDDAYAVIADRRLGGSPGSRGASAVDRSGDTAWQTPFDDVVGATLTIEHPVPLTDDTFVLEWLDDGRHSIPTEVTVTSDDGTVRTVAIPPTEPVDGRARVELSLGAYQAGRSTVTFTGVDQRTTPEYFSGLPKVLPLGITNLRLGATPNLTVDPDTALDDTCRDDLLTLDGEPVPVRVLGTHGEAITRGELTVEMCEPSIELDAGVHVLRATPGAVSGFDLDRLTLDGEVRRDGGTPAASPVAPPTVTIDGVGDTRVEATVAASDAPAWVVLEQSWNAGWTASADGDDLGAPVLIDGYANGWLLDAADGDRSIVFEWTPQRGVVFALWFSLLAGLGVVGVLVRTRRAAMPTGLGEPVDPERPDRWRSSPILAAGLVGAVAFFAGPLVAVGALIVLVSRHRWSWLAPAVVLLAGGVAAGWIVAAEWRYDYPPGPDWPSRFGWTAPVVWLAVATVVVVAVMPRGVRARQ